MRVVILERGQLVSSLDAETGPIRIGSAVGNQIHVSDPRISPHQATIVRDDHGDWWLEINDLLRPTTVNRSIIKDKVQLGRRDEIEIGPFTLRIHLDNEGDIGSVGGDEWHRRMVDVTKSHSDSLPLGTITVRHDKPLTLGRELLEQFSLLAMRLERVEAIQDVMMPVLRAALRAFAAGRAWIGLRKTERGDFNWQLCIGSRGESAPRPAASASMQHRCMVQSQYVCVPKIPHEGLGSAMGAPLIYEHTTIGMLYVENDATVPPYDESSLDQFSALTCCVAMPIGDVMRKTAVTRRELGSHELTVTREVQDAVTPHALPHWENLHLAAYRHAGAEHVCDFYDVVQLKDKSAAMILARVTAQGAQRPRFLAEVRAAFRMSCLHDASPAVLLRALNWLLLTGDNTRYIDAVAVHVDPAVGAVQYSVAGNRVLLGRIHADGKCERVESPAAPAIGQQRHAPYEAHSVDLAVRDTLVLATDGANAARNAKGEPFGIEAMHDTLCDGLGHPPGQLLHDFDEDLRDFLANGGKCAEDITIVLAQRH